MYFIAGYCWGMATMVCVWIIIRITINRRQTDDPRLGGGMSDMMTVEEHNRIVAQTITAMDAERVSFETQIENKKNENQTIGMSLCRVQRELTEAQTEIARLQLNYTLLLDNTLLSDDEQRLSEVTKEEGG